MIFTRITWSTLQLKEHDLFGEELATLHKQFDDIRIGLYDREHLYLQYWRLILQQKNYLTPSEIESLVSRNEYSDAIGDLVLQLCKNNLLSEENREWLLLKLPLGSFAHEQVEALILLDNINIDWKEKLLKTFDLHSNWAAYIVLTSVPINEVESARAIIKDLKKPKWLLEALPTSNS